ncbi:MAG TPA: hypothetical protein VML55_02070 [Planctomycetaceae bacterium]|nr:hypothetical protein [Planctomycetaceae bacterium]
MSRTRTLTLTAGPVLLVGASYWLTMTRTVRGFVPPAERPAAAAAVTAEPDEPLSQLDAACTRAAARLAEQLGSDRPIVIRPPYVLAGDLPEYTLTAWYEQLVRPLAGCLRREFFDRDPDRPIVIVLCPDESAYRRMAQVLDGRTSPLWYGYYRRDERRIVVNVSTGHGTLAHELVHALAHVDCPGLPEWFEEGLAALFEQFRFSDDGQRLEGLSNWRLAHLRGAIEHDRLRPLSRLAGGAPPLLEPADYAHVRYLCLYLQERGLLAMYYRRLRANLDHDPGGLGTLCELLNVNSPEMIDRDFRAWALTLR